VVEEGSGVRGQGRSGGVVTMATRAWRYYRGGGQGQGEHKRAVVLDHSVVEFYLTFSKSCSGFLADLFTAVPVDAKNATAEVGCRGFYVLAFLGSMASGFILF
jgi:hypothetical protein